MSLPELAFPRGPEPRRIRFAGVEHPYIDRLGEAHARLVATASALDDVAVAAPSLLPGWDRAMVLTHLANNADAVRRCIEVAARGGVAEMYPGGPAQRDAAIEAGRAARAAVVERRTTESCRQLQQALTEAPQSAWNGKAISRAGEVLVGPGLVVGRLREVEVHHVDLQCGYSPADWNYGWVVEEMDRAMLSLPSRLQPGTAVVLTATDSEQHWVAGNGDAVEISGPAAEIYAWVTGRATSVGGHDCPSLAPWR